MQENEKYYNDIIKKSKEYVDKILNEEKLKESFKNIFLDYYDYHSRYK